MTTAGASPPAHTNSLIHETSPYLLQHAHNPVDWHPWGTDAIELARAQDKPIFLSVGYSTCYWCHVMERESFENEAIAALMNEHFICIKVDREERPDVDDIYMSAVQAMSGSGGWPMSVFLDPRTLTPFYGGTYYPAQPMYGRPSFPQLLHGLADAWTTRRDEVQTQAARVAEAVRLNLAVAAEPHPIGRVQVDQAVAVLKRIYDPEHGGFGSAPKFPQPVFIQLLMGVAWDEPETKAAVLHTLDRMAIGGIFDQVGGGFHRYSTDEKWLVPHFEKMLYDNGQLASVYAEAFARTSDPFYKQVLRATLDYVLREMTDPRGGFFSAQDAEVEAREGLNYLWTPEEVRQALAHAGLNELTDFALRVYGLDRGPNFRDPHHPEEPARNVIHLTDQPEAQARELELSLEAFHDRISKINAALLAARSQRKQPRLDDKVLAGWNGLMIAGLADGGCVLREPRYLDAAARGARFVRDSMRREDGRLLRSWRNGQAKIDAFLEDYALMIRAVIALHRATGEPSWLDTAEALTETARSLFQDHVNGGYFDTLADQPDLFVRTKSGTDGALPSGNGVMLLNLLDLYELTKEQRFIDDAAQTIRAFSGALSENPVATALSTLALHRMLKLAPQALESTMPAAPAPAPAGPAADPVIITCSVDELRITVNQPARAELAIVITKPYHINAHEPGDDSLIPLQLRLDDGAGFILHVDYPPGALFNNEIRVHHDQVTILFTIQRLNATAKAPRLMLTYQPCTESACLRPVTKSIPLRIVLDE